MLCERLCPKMNTHTKTLLVKNVEADSSQLEKTQPLLTWLPPRTIFDGSTVLIEVG